MIICLLQHQGGDGDIPVVKRHLAVSFGRSDPPTSVFVILIDEKAEKDTFGH